MFGFKKKQKWLLSDSKKKSLEYDVPSQLRYWTPMGGCRQLEFIPHKSFVHLVENMDSIIDKFMNEVTLDEFNSGTFMDEYIDLIVDLAKKDYQKQAIEHAYVIKSIKQIERGYLLGYKSELKQLEKFLSEKSSEMVEEGRTDETKAA